MAISGTLLLISFIGCVLASEPGTPNYIETGDCESKEACSYSYAAHQEYFGDDGQQMVDVNATVDITCTSSGLYNNSDAKLYCMSVTDANIMSNLMENSSDREIRDIQQSINKQLKNWFCFVQTYNGKVPAVYHSSSEPEHAISLKKSIAAAFQANFEGTEEEDEIDPQSSHTSHYNYIPTDEEGVLKMKRTVKREDVKEYPFDAPKDDIDTSKEEEVQYRSGKLEKSAGNTSFHLVNNSSPDDSDLESFSLSQTFAASGSYTMELESCHKLNERLFGTKKRIIVSEMKQDSKEEDLKASVNKEKEGIEHMKVLREKLPSGSALKAIKNYNAYGEKLIHVLQTLMELESKYGALPLYIPVIDEVMTFSENMPHSTADREVREAVVMLLSTEGSLKSQMVLLTAYDNALDSDEANTILTHISFMESVKIGFIIGLEQRLQQPNGERFLADQLLLVYGSLATKGSVEVENRVLSFLTSRASNAREDLNEVTLLLHALGNTGSKQSITPILSFLTTSSNDHNKIKLIVIESLDKVTDDPVVLTALEKLFQEDRSLECIATVVETLNSGFDFIQKTNKDYIQDYIDSITAHTIVHSLAEVVADANNTELHSMMEHYLKKIKASEDLFTLIYNVDGPLGSRAKRGTTDWDSTISSDYNYVEALATRQYDVNRYDRHQAYINSKRRGVDNANIKIAYGYFAGTSSHCDALKAFGRMKVVGKLFSRTSTLAEAKVDLRLDLQSASVTVYVKIGSNTLVNYYRTYGNPSTPCLLYSRSITQWQRRIFTWGIPIFIYVGTLTLSVDVYVHFNMGVNANLCRGRSGTEITGALGSLTPTVGVTVTGSVEANLLYLVKGGVEVSVTLNYRLEPAVSVQACTATCSFTRRMCLGLYDSYHGSNIALEVYYQIQSVRMCGRGWARYPCFRWGRRRRWDRLSGTWPIIGQTRRAIRQVCDGNLHPLCASSALSSPLFTA